MESVASAIEESRKQFPGETGVYFVDIESNLELGFDAEKQFESASLMKLVVIAEVYRRIQIGELELDHPLTLQPDQIVGGSGDLKDLEAGMAFPVSVLAEKMITQSDNTATQMLTDFLTKDDLNKSVRNLGLTGTTIDRDIYDFPAIDQGHDNYITAKDAARLMEQLAREELPGSAEIHIILERQQRNDMIGNGFPPNVRVAHKTGELNGIVHDVGIVYAPRGSYVLALLSDKVSNKELAIETWSKLSLKILTLYQQQSPTPSPQEDDNPTD
jgi:beta-lactamase class A